MHGVRVSVCPVEYSHITTAAMPDVKYEVPGTGNHEDGTARKQTQEIQAQGTGCNS